MQERRKILSSSQRWKNREELVERALSNSAMWFFCVNVSFSLMIYFRNGLFNFDVGIVERISVLKLIDDLMLAITFAAMVTLLLQLNLAKKLYLRYVYLLSILMLAMLWAVSVHFILTFWNIPFSYPLAVILIMSAVIALYANPLSLILFVLPLWLAVFVSNIILHQGIAIRFQVIWLIFTAIVFYAQKILRHWLDLAWLRDKENQQLITKLEQMANVDALTGIANRRAMDQRLVTLSQAKEPFSIILLDVDLFKKYNDFYGHQQGDECLIRIAQLLQSAVRTPDDIVARYGGEEFLLILIGAQKTDAVQVADRIIAAVNQAKIAHEKSAIAAWVTMSMGIASSTETDDVGALIKLADEKLYISKSSGRNQWN